MVILYYKHTNEHVPSLDEVRKCMPGMKIIQEPLTLSILIPETGSSMFSRNF